MAINIGHRFADNLSSIKNLDDANVGHNSQYFYLLTTIVLLVSHGFILFGISDPLLAQTSVSMTADDIRYDEANGILRAEGNYVILHADAELKASQGSYNHNNGQSILVGEAVLQVGGERFEALRVTGNHNDGIFLLEENVRYYPAPELVMRSSALIYFMATAMARLSGSVQVEYAQWRATAETAEVTREKILLYGVRLENSSEWVEENSAKMPQEIERLTIDRQTLKLSVADGSLQVHPSR